MKRYIIEVNDDEAELIEDARMDGVQLWLAADDGDGQLFEFEVDAESLR